ncbi:hypothetical protein [Stenotrophomonas tumulicola]|uniref:Uncharacterized protein n=1 Tax=Stenotrophomonas tumulicola TaxID=1685415 RepID=A0A7W3FMZ1_9GAMM|nr:hypothetical protein [Stenotrophomonas tumulicola]MBA8682167.1 hypothetical protein [Stenotrophomonas tumulicola]
MPKRNGATRFLVVVVVAAALFVAGYFVGKALGEADARDGTAIEAARS